jgi:hypothetical protein
MQFSKVQMTGKGMKNCLTFLDINVFSALCQRKLIPMDHFFQMHLFAEFQLKFYI